MSTHFVKLVDLLGFVSYVNVSQITCICAIDKPHPEIDPEADAFYVLGKHTKINIGTTDWVRVTEDVETVMSWIRGGQDL